LYTRTRDFAGGFARTLALADKVVLLPIYPAREEPIEGVTSEMIAKLMQSGKPEVMDPKQVLSHIESYDNGVICTVGAGDVDRLINPIKEILSRKHGTS
jgi:UDP-N-acetylmuramate--alanine ligase